MAEGLFITSLSKHQRHTDTSCVAGLQCFCQAEDEMEAAHISTLLFNVI